MPIFSFANLLLGAGLPTISPVYLPSIDLAFVVLFVAADAGLAAAGAGVGFAATGAGPGAGAAALGCASGALLVLEHALKSAARARAVTKVEKRRIFEEFMGI